MRKIIFSIVGGTVGLALGLGVPGNETDAQTLTSKGGPQRVLACYVWNIFPNERYKLDIRFHSPLSEKEEEERQNHPAQVVFSVHGKHVGVCGTKPLTGPDQFGAITTVRPVVGTLISVRPLGLPGGARLGLETFATTGVPGIAFNWCKDVEISCKADILAGGFPPPVWNCFSQNKHPVEHFPSRLVLVDEVNDPLCSQFEDGIPIPAPGRPDTDCFVPPFDTIPATSDSTFLVSSGCLEEDFGPE